MNRPSDDSGETAGKKVLRTDDLDRGLTPDIREEVRRREGRISELLIEKAELEWEFRRLSPSSALRGGDVSRMQVLERFRKDVKRRLQKQQKKIEEAQQELHRARERLGESGSEVEEDSEAGAEDE